ncbi:MAG: HD domain-containing protein [Caldithrix sp.]|nr:HD domain-containing protein [Caldithrix sp.]
MRLKQLNNDLKHIAESIALKEKRLFSDFATGNEQAFRREAEDEQHYRPPFALDRDRIFYSGAFRRYTGKTQVIYFVSLLDEQLTSRILHTLSVAQISTTIGRMLSLNTDLIDAIALGHDLGHPPFGHDGEKFLDEISRKHSLGYFHHNIQSLRVVDHITKNGRGLNLTFQTRDGILAHNGEVHNQVLQPRQNGKEDDLLQYMESMQNGQTVDLMPATSEGCVVRLADTIAYIGQDIEDAIRVGLIKREELPENPARKLGTYNGQIVDTLVNDVVAGSYQKSYVTFSNPISDALLELKNFNYKSIYKSKKLKVNHQRIKRGFSLLFDYYLQAMENDDRENEIFTHFLNTKDAVYIDETSPALRVRDFMAGMTDRYFSQMLAKAVVPVTDSLEVKNT